MMPPSRPLGPTICGTSAPTDSPPASRESHSYFGRSLSRRAQAISRRRSSFGDVVQPLVDEFIHPQRTQLTPEPAALDAAEWHLLPFVGWGVDVGHARL